MILLHPDPMLINIFINNWDEGTEGLLIKSVNNSKLGIIANSVDEREEIHEVLNRLEQWIEMSGMKINKKKYQVPHLDGKN